MTASRDSPTLLTLHEESDIMTMQIRRRNRNRFKVVRANRSGRQGRQYIRYHKAKRAQSAHKMHWSDHLGREALAV